MGIRKFLYATVALLLSFSALAAGPQRGKEKEKDKDRGQTPAYAGAQCSPGTGGPGASAQETTPIPVEEMIRRFAQHESDFKVARDNYTYTQEFLMKEGDGNGVPGGEYQYTSEVIFTPQGKRYEHYIYAPPSTLHRLVLTSEDMKDLESVQPFVLTAEDLPKYDVQYAGMEKLDELNTYKFCVGPKRIEKNQRYFRGTIWVDTHDLAVVKSDGKAVPEIGNQQFPRFATYRENIEGTFWFPTYTHADDVLHFKDDDVQMRMTVRYKNYKRFGSTIQLGKSTEVPGTPSGPPQTQPAPKK